MKMQGRFSDQAYLPYLEDYPADFRHMDKGASEMRARVRMELTTENVEGARWIAFSAEPT